MSLADWRDLSIVLLVIEALILSLVPAVLLYFCVQGMLWVLKQVRAFMPKVQRFFRKVAEVSDQTSRRIVAPVISVNAGTAQLWRWLSFFTAPSPHIKEEV